MERVKGIEPSQSAWKAEVLPLNYTRKMSSFTGIKLLKIIFYREIIIEEIIKMKEVFNHLYICVCFYSIYYLFTVNLIWGNNSPQVEL
ncbi:hypothetical protein MS53_0702 [Mycoplasmopsis synoviae 53]|uniref:Uncharacterized protein n=1 Tax=Mycoplasmopsis synoviae (strain 53) TaxID=262723 RepID=A4Q804_MYCS5|nr:hypothetical protein MS53_0702 [Mycoplasmopsis synoviae 53]